MNIEEKILNYQQQSIDQKQRRSIFLDLADEIVMNFPYRLNNKTYLLIPDKRKELIEMAYEYSFSTGKTMPISLTLSMSEIMNKFNDIAENLGFTIITKMSDYHNDGQLFDLLGRESIDNDLFEENEYNFTNVKIPLTLSVDDFVLNPFYPVVFKNHTANRGEDKYLIESDKQLKKIMALFELPESKKINLKNEFIVQEYIGAFEDINGSIRVFVTCTGDILSSLFLVSMDTAPKKRTKIFGIDVFNPCEYLSNPDSPYYLNSKNIISNAASGGEVIPLNPKISNISPDDEIILTLHEIDLETLSLPSDIIDQCKEIVSFWGTKKGIVLGIDFIYNSNNDSWYYLETNRNPSVDGYKHFMNLKGYLKKDIKALMQLDSLTKIVENVMNRDMTASKVKGK